MVDLGFPVDYGIQRYLTNNLLAKTAKEIDANVDKDIILFFMTDETLKNFRTSKGWEVGLL